MSNTYSILEVLQIAINMEMKGHEYYLDAAIKATGAKAKEIFLGLAGEEKKHIELFAHLHMLLSEITKIDDEYVFDENIQAYFKYLSEESVFRSKEQDKMAKLDSLKEIIYEGINAEKNSILYYSEMLKGTNNAEVKKVLNIIIDEEKKHILQLTEMIKEL